MPSADVLSVMARQAIDQLLVATKFERKQMVASFVFSVTYVTFNIVWFLTAPKDERVIYSVMDWGDSVGNSAATALIIVFVLVPIAGVIHYCVFRWVVGCKVQTKIPLQTGIVQSLYTLFGGRRNFLLRFCGNNARRTGSDSVTQEVCTLYEVCRIRFSRDVRLRKKTWSSKKLNQS